MVSGVIPTTQRKLENSSQKRYWLVLNYQEENREVIKRS